MRQKREKEGVFFQKKPRAAFGRAEKPPKTTKFFRGSPSPLRVTPPQVVFENFQVFQNFQKIQNFQKL